MQSQIRTITNKFLRPLVIKERCETCDSREGLQLHHITPFALLFEECIDKLGYGYHEDKSKYSKVERENIENIMLGEQLRSKYLTLCKECHIEVHAQDGGHYNTTDNHKLHYIRKEIQDTMIENKRVEDVLIPFLEANIEKPMLRPSDRDGLIQAVNVRCKNNGVLRRGIGFINGKLEDFNLPYRVVTYKIDKRRKGKKRENYTCVWKIVEYNREV